MPLSVGCLAAKAEPDMSVAGKVHITSKSAHGLKGHVEQQLQEE